MQKSALIKSLLNYGFDEKIISAFRRINREDFVSAGNEDFAYDDMPLSIGYKQTISQPHTIAFMLKLLEVQPGLKVLEVGSGSGYVLALLGELLEGGEVYGVEIIPELLERSQEILKDFKNIKLFEAGESLGLSALAPFDRILVSAAASEIPAELLKQLAEGGILVCPVKDDIVRIKKEKSGITKTFHHGFSFVPLIE